MLDLDVCDIDLQNIGDGAASEERGNPLFPGKQAGSRHEPLNVIAAKGKNFMPSARQLQLDPLMVKAEYAVFVIHVLQRASIADVYLL